MACCVLVAFLLSRAIRTCQSLDILGIATSTGTLDEDVATTKPVSQYATAKVSITGMSCGACSAKIEQAVGQLDGVSRVAVALSFHQATISYDESKISLESLIHAIEKLGYEAKPGQRSVQESLKALQHQEELERLQRSLSGALTCSILLALTNTAARYGLLNTTTGGAPSILFSQWAAPLIELAIFFRLQHRHLAWIHRSAWKSFRAPTMHTLTSSTQALGLAASLSNLLLLLVRGDGDGRPPAQRETHFATCALLALVVLAARLANLLLRRDATAAALTGLFRLQAELALVRVHRRATADAAAANKGEMLPAALLRPGDEIAIEPLDAVPCDAYVLLLIDDGGGGGGGDDDRALLDVSVVTGESAPVEKRVGEFVLAGSRNVGRARFVAVVARRQDESTLAAILDGVVEAATAGGSGNAEAEEEGGGGGGGGGWVGGLMRDFVGVVLGAAVLGAAGEIVEAEVLGRDVGRAVDAAAQRAMAVLAAACPCALGLAVPSAMMSFIDVASSGGILLTGGARSIEALTTVTHIVLDKTGTLTKGELHVTAFEMLGPACIERKVLLQLICAVEAPDAQVHPVAKAVFAWAVRRLQDIGERPNLERFVTKYQTVPGSGAECVVEVNGDARHDIVVGNSSFLQSKGIEVRAVEKWERQNSHGTSVYFAVDGQCLGRFGLQDVPRPEAKETIQQLKEGGYELTMLTGDSEAEAQRISEMLGISVLGSGALPGDKKAFITELQLRGHKVAMVGDGINDGPALATAEVGIQLSLPRRSSSGAGDVVLMRQDLTYLPRLFRMARRTIKQARMNVLWALVYNLLALLFAMGAFEAWGLRANASITGTMMASSSMTILVAGIFLRSYLRREITTE